MMNHCGVGMVNCSIELRDDADTVQMVLCKFVWCEIVVCIAMV